jgi:phospholipase C
MSRRKFLATMGSAGAGALLASWMPAIVDKAYAASDSVGAGSLADIEHFVFLMQENRSFDHYFGTLSGVRGFDDRTVPEQVVGGLRSTIFRQYGYQVGTGVDPNGYMLPFAFKSDLTHDDQCLFDPTHDWAPQHQAWNGGRMDKWLSTHVKVDGALGGPIIMGYYDRQTLPFYYELADAFTICDNYHCSVMGPTYPNRAYWMSGTIDPEGGQGGPILTTLSDVLPDPAAWGYLRWKTMPEVLEEAGVSWKVYQSTDATEGAGGGLLMDNILRLFKQYSQPGTTLNNKALVPNIEADFVADVASGNLPQVSWIVTDFTQCEHPAAPPSYGGVAVALILDLLTSNPALWEKTAFIINYDENGGFFDHVPPPVPPAGTPGEYVTANPPNSAEGSTGGIAGPIGLGFRVPALVISPYSSGGLVYSGVLDHTSQLKLLERKFGVSAPNLSAWRRQTVGDFTGAFNFAAAPDNHPAKLVATPDPYMVVDLDNAGFGTAGFDSQLLVYPYPALSGEVPVQEAGTRGRPSGPVAAAASSTTTTSTTNPSHVEPSTGAVTTGAATAAPANASAAPADELAQTGSPIYQDAVKGAGLVALGTAVAGLAGQLPTRRPAVTEPDAD